ncbi:hypothetical protein CBS101457_004339 [Exobasidium rhododendri]|nr:hypothetical protein CBS101457_004339 [Exobasidium rhododendri]
MPVTTLDVDDYKRTIRPQYVSSPLPIPLSASAQHGTSSSFSPRKTVRLSSPEIQPLDLDEVGSTSYSVSPDHPQKNFLGTSEDSSARILSHEQTREGGRSSRSSVTSDFAKAGGQFPKDAHYVTVSAILSRSGTAVTSFDGKDGDANRTYGSSVRRRSSVRKSSEALEAASPEKRPNFPRRKTSGGTEQSVKRRASNGSALEALGALLLQRDSSGKVSNLSFARHHQDKREIKGRRGPSTPSKSWLHDITEAGAAHLGMKIPQRGDAGQTIAQRRARSRSFLFRPFFHQAEEDSESDDGQSFIRVGTKPWQPTFEVGKLRSDQTVSPTSPQAPGPRLRAPALHESHNAHDRYSRTESRKDKAPIFGKESSRSAKDLLNAPPSPIAMPGAWSVGGSGWGSTSADWREEGALLLPPPLLDDLGSDAKSFEGLLGVRRMREQERSKKQLEKLRARNRPAHKVGILTAFTNFVKAAHAADKASKIASTSTLSRPVDMLSRRHTEPVHVAFSQKRSSADEDAEVIYDDGEDDDDDDDVDMYQEEEEAPIDPPLGRVNQFNRGYFKEGTDSQVIKPVDTISRSLDTVHESQVLGSGQEEQSPGRVYRRSSTTNTRRSSSTFDRSTPRAPTLLPVHLSISTPGTPLVLDSDDPPTEYAKSRKPSAPPTPRLGPTLMSLPPSPWMDETGSILTRDYTMQLIMTHTNGPPGTPRLAPSSLEIVPSPIFPSPKSASVFKSPKVASYSNGGHVTPTDILSPFSLSPRQSPLFTATLEADRRSLGAKKEFSGNTRSANRMTPSVMISASRDVVSGTRGASTPAEANTDVAEGGEGGDELHTDSNKGRTAFAGRSFVLWFLIGDLGLTTRSTIAAKASGLPLPTETGAVSKNYGVLLSFLAHLYGFTVFVLAHLVDLTYRVAEFLSMTFWFLRWMALNLTGQTVLAGCVIEAYRLVEREWQTVCMEDHEDEADTGNKKSKAKLAKKRGLTRWQVMKGMLELICLQDVTREQFFQEGAGLEELQGWKRTKQSKGVRSGPAQTHRVDQEPESDAFRRSIVSLNDGDIDEDEGDDENESESDNDDMVVTRQGGEILEFTKTPKVEYSDYFHQTEMQSTGSERGSDKVEAPRDESNRSLVKTIKWASRLAISAYGLHITLVDLPATFTPSGDRFSRQTFAHLSRLHHEDVLHADIQTLDSDAYSPTFYLVRDLARKVIVVSVRGTQSLQDIIVDLEIIVEEVALNDGEQNAEKLLCHAGVLRAAKALISSESTLFKTLNEALEENKGFGIVWTGHSLGGAIASTVVLLLSKYVLTEGEEEEEGRWMTHSDSGLPADRSIRAITFAHPATVNANLANRAAKGKMPLVLSVILGSDFIPRCGHGQARELRRVLGGLSRVRRRKGDLLFPKRDTEDARVHILTSWWRWKMIGRKGEKQTQKEKKLAERIETELWALRCDVENDLYAAVKQRSLMTKSDNLPTKGQDDGTEERRGMTLYPPSPWIGPSQRAKAPLHQLAARRQTMDAITLQNEESNFTSGILVPAGKSILIHKSSLYEITSPLSFFSLPDFHPRMFAEHFPSAYETALLEDIKL